MEYYNRFDGTDNLELGTLNNTRMAILFALDKSGSMGCMNSVGMTAMDLLLTSINRFKDDICMDEKAAEAVDVAVVAFDSEARVVQPFGSIKNMNYVSMEAFGGTNLAAGLTLSADMIQEQTKMYEELYPETKKPWLVLITDGNGGDITGVAQRITERIKAQKLKIFILAVEGYNEHTVELLTEGYKGTKVRPVFKITEKNGFDFNKIFNFLEVSTKVASVSAPGTRITSLPGLPPIPDLDELLG